MASAAVSDLKSLYIEREGSNPSYFVEAPGRVNIIGEHVDHQYYDVLPTCINRSIKIVAGNSKENYTLKITHKNSSRFPSFEASTPKDVKMNRSKISYHDYILAGMFGVLEYCSTENYSLDNVGMLDTSVAHSLQDILDKSSNLKVFPKAFTLLMDGNIPIAAGTSSSSALVVASIKITLEALSLTPDQRALFTNREIAQIAIKAECHVGVAGGGMDQSIICMGSNGKALRIGFAPLNTTEVTLPPDMKLVIANTGLTSAKADTAPVRYNKRVMELRLANRVLGSLITPSLVWSDTDLPRTRDLEKICNTTRPVMLSTLEAMPDIYTKADLEKIFPSETLKAALSLAGNQVWTRNETFRLKQAVRHVLTEQDRVERFHATCIEGKDEYEKLGLLMDGSQASLKEDYDCSMPETDKICTIARSNGAFGARLTGAGWGGCCVLAVRSADVERVMDSLVEHYYKPTYEIQKSSSSPSTIIPEICSKNPRHSLEDFLFVVVPSDCARSSKF